MRSIKKYLQREFLMEKTRLRVKSKEIINETKNQEMEFHDTWPFSRRLGAHLESELQFKN